MLWITLFLLGYIANVDSLTYIAILPTSSRHLAVCYESKAVRKGGSIYSLTIFILFLQNKQLKVELKRVVEQKKIVEHSNSENQITLTKLDSVEMRLRQMTERYESLIHENKELVERVCSQRSSRSLHYHHDTLQYDLNQKLNLRPKLLRIQPLNLMMWIDIKQSLYFRKA